MSKTIYDIFISYRRDGGGATAGRINDMLTADGYSVSYDVDTLREGRFDEQLLERIEQCQDFILVVDRNCFARTVDPATNPKDDWLWQELSYALRLKKNIIPVLLAGASFPESLPKDIDSVRLSNGPKCVHEYFDSFYIKLKDFLHAYPRMTESQSAGRVAPTNMMPCLKLKADLDCIFYLDGEEHSHLKAGIIKKIPLAKGEYELMFVSEENDADNLELEFEMPEVDKLMKVNLREIMNGRVQKEKENMRLADEKRKAEEASKLAEERKREAERKAAEEERKRCEEEKRKREAERIAAEEDKRRREEDKRRREEEKLAKERTFNVGGVLFKMIRIEGGIFQMGNNSERCRGARSDELPVHSVTLSNYYIGQTEVTQALWQAVMGDNPSEHKGGNLPVERISWIDCQKFISKLNKLTGQMFRLPTEAEWEYAARGGKNSKGYKYSGSNTLDNVAWYMDNSGHKTHPVASKHPNELNLYDMSGNVWEWCWDWNDYYPSCSVTNPKGPLSGSYRMLRGGCYLSVDIDCQVSIRGYWSPSFKSYWLGFRLAL